MDKKTLAVIVNEKCRHISIDDNFKFVLDNNTDNWRAYELFKYHRKDAKIFVFYNSTLALNSDSKISAYLDNIISHVIAGNETNNISKHNFPIDVNPQTITNGLIAYFENASAKKHKELFGESSYSNYLFSISESINSERDRILNNRNDNPIAVHMALHQYLFLLSSSIVVSYNPLDGLDAFEGYLSQFAREIDAIVDNNDIQNDEKLKLAEMIGAYSANRCNLITTILENRIVGLPDADLEWMHWRLLEKNYIQPDTFMEFSRIYLRAEKFLKENAVRE